VNVGAIPSNINAPWIDWSDWDAENGNDVNTQTCTKVVSKRGRKTNQCVGTTTWVPAAHTTWNGCIADRDQDYDVKNTAPNPADKSLPPASASTLFPADQESACPVPMMGLTNDWTALNSKVDAMTPNGYTNQAIGLAWAWQALSPGQPMNAPVKGPDVQQIIILLTILSLAPAILIAEFPKRGTTNSANCSRLSTPLLRIYRAWRRSCESLPTQRLQSR
jgi:hypothetical protein